MRKPRKLYEYQLLFQQARSAVEEDFAEVEEWVVGDSEIERLFHAALVYRIRLGRTEFYEVYTVPDGGRVEYVLEEHPGYVVSRHGRIVVQSQVQIGEWRVDFLIRAWTGGSVYTGGEPRRTETDPHWRRLVVECDGHDFHERTKEQAAKDRARDRGLNALGYDVFRFTGSELWRDPWGCAEQVYEWATRGI